MASIRAMDAAAIRKPASITPKKPLDTENQPAIQIRVERLTDIGYGSASFALPEYG